MNEPLFALSVPLVAGAMLVLLFWPGLGLVPRLGRGARMSERVLSEDALKYICKREAKGYPPTVASIAGTLQMSTNRVSEILARLVERKLVFHEGELLRLTEEGRAYALSIIRAHRLWERYLADTTGYSEAEWHELADRREHQLSSGDVEQLAKRLGSPTHDPHGDPIPSATRGHVFHGGRPLTTAEPHVPLRIVHIE
ncbi:MAG: hypothetical protein EHM19_08115, partial [Candidatus Latescibacterota bacterium]